MVPTRQRAAAVTLAHSHEQLRLGLSSWPSCDVLPWSAWLARAAQPARHGALAGVRRLGAHEEWLAWRAAAGAACERTEQLNPISLAEGLRRAAARARDWGLERAMAAGDEARVLERARAFMRQYCRDQRAVSNDDWTVLLADARAGPQPLLFAGFDELGTQLAARLRSLGGEIDMPIAAAGGVGGVGGVGGTEVYSAHDRTEELRAAAHWCRQWLLRDARARLLVIVPELATCRALIEQAFDHALYGGALLAGADADTAVGAEGAPERRAALYAIEGGIALAEYPLVRTALDLLRLVHEGLDFGPLALLLRSGFWGGREPEALAARALLELAARERNVLRAGVPELVALARLLPSARGAALSETLQAQREASPPVPTPRAGEAEWARHFAGVLEHWGWPGAQSLSSSEQQQRERFEDLLGELAALGEAPAVRSGSALELLRALAAHTRFQPATDDVAVTLSADGADPLVHYDGIWVVGLNAGSWPKPMQPDPFLPIALQRAAGLKTASHEGQLELARRHLAGWQQRAARVVLSCAQVLDDVPLAPSPLLGALSVPPPSGAEPGPTPNGPRAGLALDGLVSALSAGQRLELRPQDARCPWPAERALPRGTRTVTLQAACPFRANAELRLDAASVRAPRPGLDPRERGALLHTALQTIWRELASLQGLRARSASALSALVNRAVHEALGHALRERIAPLPAHFLANERARSAALIGQLLESEKARADFTIATLEEDETHMLAGAAIQVRVDRRDALPDGRVILIDYKSGAPQTFRPVGTSSDHVQLLVYAALGGPALGGVAAAHLRADGVQWRGAAGDASIFPALPRARAVQPPWPELLAHWRAAVEAWVREFVAGHAAVQPAPRACDHCHLAALCRIDASAQAVNDISADESEAAAMAESPGEGA